MYIETIVKHKTKVDEIVKLLNDKTGEDTVFKLTFEIKNVDESTYLLRISEFKSMLESYLICTIIDSKCLNLFLYGLKSVIEKWDGESDLNNLIEELC